MHQWYQCKSTTLINRVPGWKPSVENNRAELKFIGSFHKCLQDSYYISLYMCFSRSQTYSSTQTRQISAPYSTRETVRIITFWGTIVHTVVFIYAIPFASETSDIDFYYSCSSFLHLGIALLWQPPLNPKFSRPAFLMYFHKICIIHFSRSYATLFYLLNFKL